MGKRTDARRTSVKASDLYSSGPKKWRVNTTVSVSKPQRRRAVQRVNRTIEMDVDNDLAPPIADQALILDIAVGNARVEMEPDSTAPAGVVLTVKRTKPAASVENSVR